jgi:hypothetical protein
VFIFVLGLGVLKLLNTLNSYDWLRVHSVLDSISKVHQSSSNVCDPLMIPLWEGVILLVKRMYPITVPNLPHIRVHVRFF